MPNKTVKETALDQLLRSIEDLLESAADEGIDDYYTVKNLKAYYDVYAFEQTVGDLKEAGDSLTDLLTNLASFYGLDQTHLKAAEKARADWIKAKTITINRG